MELTYKKITVKDSNNRRLLIFLWRCSEYFMLCENKRPTTKTLEEILTEVPEGYSTEDKVVIEVLEGDKVVGLIDILRGYPDKKAWMIGLLLIAPEFRRLGYGKLIHKEIKRMAKADGAERLRIGVVEENLKAHRFWRKLEYDCVKKSRVDFGGLLKGIIIMTLDI